MAKAAGIATAAATATAGAILIKKHQVMFDSRNASGYAFFVSVLCPKKFKKSCGEKVVLFIEPFASRNRWMAALANNMPQEVNMELPLNDIEANSDVPREPFTLLNRYGNKLKHLNHIQLEERNSLSSKSQLLSAVTIMRIVLSQSTHEKRGDVYKLVESDYAEHLKRVLWLLDASEKLDKRHYDEAEELLGLALSGSLEGHPIETVLTLSGKYLRERIYEERGRIDLERAVEHVDIEQAVMDLKVNAVEIEQKLPSSQISNFTGVQTILDSVAAAERIHFIDFGPKFGSYWILVMDALARRGVKQLKISAVCSARHRVEETGNLLSSFAESMNLPFVLTILHLETWEFEKDRLQLEAGETVAVFMEFCLTRLSDHPKGIGPLLRGIKDLNPLILIIVDVETDINAVEFAPRFKEALLLMCALVDSLEACLGRENQYRKIVEKIYFQEVICNGVLREDEDGGFKRCYKIDVWREYFAEFGLVETELSQPSLHQARLMVKGSPSWSSCMLKMNGKSMIIGWNGIPIRFVSAWKFSNDKAQRNRWRLVINNNIVQRE
ncbi:DELLA protein RGL1-like [Salvia hispanica]|uniref:DELLA protein RGL1-like n=1 Tax=Salvia hispanica TaxID=49212 RepID=UPI002009D554|nr:DELLA protein RGL1-like [Salvia hispanica]